MFKIKVNDYSFVAHTDGITGITTIDNNEISTDIVEVKENIFHMLLNNQSFTAEVMSVDFTEKQLKIRVNNNIYTVTAEDKYDDLLKKMGFDLKNNSQADNIKAPMPGLVLEIKVKEGQKILKGEAVVVLEAMKMENILKATADGTVKRIAVDKGDKVEKNDILIETV